MANPTVSVPTQTGAEAAPQVEIQNEQSSPVVRIPSQEDWIDYGAIFEAGAPGEWDLYLWGGFAFSTIKKDNVYFLYYQGAGDYRPAGDETVLWRAIGVATSLDGVHFTKYEHNPVLTWFPNQNGEEGAVSSAVALSDNEEIVLYYGANTEESAISINANVRTAVSSDGLAFTDHGVVLDRTDRSVWASGDELFSVAALHDQEKWILYYIPNGGFANRLSGNEGRLGVAYGDQFDRLPDTAAVKSGQSTVPVWGTVGAVRIEADTYALILNNVREQQIEIRLTSPAAPEQVSEPVETYQFENFQQANLLLDEEKQTWFLYYRAADHYGVMLAPAGDPDITLPSTPQDLSAVVLNGGKVSLSWEASEDQDTGVVHYRVYRDGKPVGVAHLNHFDDAPTGGAGAVKYQVSAVNYHSLEGEKSLPVAVTVP